MMNNYSRYPGRGGQRPTLHNHRGSMYHALMESGQLWTPSPAQSWIIPHRGARGMGPHVGVIGQKRHTRKPYNFGRRGQPPPVQNPPQFGYGRTAFRVPLGNGRGSGIDLFSEQNQKRGGSAAEQMGRGRGLFPMYSRVTSKANNSATSGCSPSNRDTAFELTKSIDKGSAEGTLGLPARSAQRINGKKNDIKEPAEINLLANTSNITRQENISAELPGFPCRMDRQSAIKSDPALSLSPKVKDAIAKSTINKSPLQSSLQTVCGRLNILSSQQAAHAPKNTSVTEETCTKSPELIVLSESTDDEVEECQVEIAEKEKSADQNRTSKSPTGQESPIHPIKSRSCPVLDKLSEFECSPDKTKTVSVAANRSESQLCSGMKSAKISQGIKQLRKLFGSTSFASVIASTSSSKESSPVINCCTNKSGLETGDALGVVGDDAELSTGLDMSTTTGELQVNDTPDESAVNMNASQFDLKECQVRLESSDIDQMSTRSLSQNSTHSAADTFRSDSPFDDSCLGVLSDDSGDELPGDELIGMATEKIYSGLNRELPSESEDESNSQQSQESSLRMSLPRAQSRKKPPGMKAKASSRESPADHRFTLDKLLEDTKETEEELGRLKAIETKFKEGREADEKNSNDRLNPEQMESILKEFNTRDSSIPEEHPGEDVFDSSLYGQIYSLPGRCRLKEDFNFVPGDTRIDQMLVHPSQDFIEEILQSEIIFTCINRISHPEAVLNWLFHSMSIHTKSLTSKCLQDLLYRVLHMKRGTTAVLDWVPSFKEIITLFLNYGLKDAALPGADYDSLFVILEVAEDLRLLVPELENPVVNDNAVNNNRLRVQSSFRHENMRFVLRVLTWALQQRPHIYSPETMKFYTLLTCRVALAEQLTQGYHTYDFKALISAQLDALGENDWHALETWLCTYLPSITDQHHNKVYLTEILPYTDRGLHLKRRLSFCMLQQLIKAGETARSPENLVVQHLHPVLQKLRVVVNADYYELWSIISLIDTCIGNESLPQTDREDLKLLMEKLGKLKSSIKEVINQLDRTIVKDKIVWLISKWKFRVQNRFHNQKSIFAFTSSRAMQEVNVVSIQDDEGSGEDEEHDSGSEKLEMEDETSNGVENDLAGSKPVVKDDTENVTIKDEFKDEVKQEQDCEVMDTS